MAWRRTTLTFAVVAILAVRLAVLAEPAHYAPAAVAALTWLAFLVLAQRRIRAQAAREPVPPGLRTLAATAACVITLAGLAAAVVM